MKVIIIDDAFGGTFAGSAAINMRKLGFDATAMMPHNNAMIELQDEKGRRNKKMLTDEEVLELVRKAEIIFLDHNMPYCTGEELLQLWRITIDFSNKRVVGISGGDQPYLDEQYDGLGSVPGIKHFFNIP